MGSGCTLSAHQANVHPGGYAEYSPDKASPNLNTLRPGRHYMFSLVAVVTCTGTRADNNSTQYEGWMDARRVSVRGKAACTSFTRFGSYLVELIASGYPLRRIRT